MYSLASACPLSYLQVRTSPEETVLANPEVDCTRKSFGHDQAHLPVLRHEQVRLIVVFWLLQVKSDAQLLRLVVELHGCGAVFIDAQADARPALAIDNSDLAGDYLLWCGFLISVFSASHLIPSKLYTLKGR